MTMWRLPKEVVHLLRCQELLQEDTMKAQGELKQQLDTVGQDVENARDDVAGVHTDLNKLGDNMNLLQQQQSYTAEGIYVLCRCLVFRLSSNSLLSASRNVSERIWQRCALMCSSPQYHSKTQCLSVKSLGYAKVTDLSWQV